MQVIMPAVKNYLHGGTPEHEHAYQLLAAASNKMVASVEAHKKLHDRVLQELPSQALADGMNQAHLALVDMMSAVEQLAQKPLEDWCKSGRLWLVTCVGDMVSLMESVVGKSAAAVILRSLPNMDAPGPVCVQLSGTISPQSTVSDLGIFAGVVNALENLSGSVATLFEHRLRVVICLRKLLSAVSKRVPKEAASAPCPSWLHSDVCTTAKCFEVFAAGAVSLAHLSKQEHTLKESFWTEKIFEEQLALLETWEQKRAISQEQEIHALGAAPVLKLVMLAARVLSNIGVAEEECPGSIVQLYKVVGNHCVTVEAAKLMWHLLKASIDKYENSLDLCHWGVVGVMDKQTMRKMLGCGRSSEVLQKFPRGSAGSISRRASRLPLSPHRWHPGAFAYHLRRASPSRCCAVGWLAACWQVAWGWLVVGWWLADSWLVASGSWKAAGWRLAGGWRVWLTAWRLAGSSGAAG